MNTNIPSVTGGRSARIQSLVTNIWKSKFVRNVVVVASGTAGAQAIAMAFSPLITRLYGPEAFGVLGTFSATVGVITPIAALSYPIAIVLPKDDGEAMGIAKLSICIAVSMSFCAAVVLFAFGKPLVELFRVEDIREYIYLIPIIIISTAWMQVNRQWLIRKSKFKVTARIAVIQAFLLNFAKVGFGFIKPFGSVLIVIYTISQIAHAWMLAKGAKKADVFPEKTSTFKVTSLWRIARKRYDFPLYRTPQITVNALSQGLPILMLAAFFGPASAGSYTLCTSVLSMPSALIGGSVSDVFYPRIAEAAHRRESLTRLIIIATLSMAAIGFVPFGLVVVFGPKLFEFVFGNEWGIAGTYARWLALWLFFAFINRPSVAAIPVLKLQCFFLVFEIASIALRLIALYIGFYLLRDDIFAVMFFSVSGLILNLSLIFITIFFSNNIDKKGRWFCE